MRGCKVKFRKRYINFNGEKFAARVSIGSFDDLDLKVAEKFGKGCAASTVGM